MELNEYQRKARFSEVKPSEEGLIISFLGLAGEAGQLLTEYKKFLRDGPAHRLFQKRVEEELGDILWYIASIASKFDLLLGEVATSNLEKIQDRWGERIQALTLESRVAYDTHFPEKERFPPSFVARIEQVSSPGKTIVRVLVDGRQMGNSLSDNFYGDDGYRFHDIFHFAYAAVLGWSPVVRKLLKRKRKSNVQIDEVEDGGRAAAIEEGITALVFAYAKDHNYFEGVREVDYHLLKTIKGLTAHLEVSTRSLREWEQAILVGYDAWRQLNLKKEGTITIDLVRGEMSVT